MKAWIGVSDGELSFSDLNLGLGPNAEVVLATELFKTRKGALSVHEDVRRVILTIPRGLEGAK